eukprot:scaffold14278_cov56-Phaeocystis_antarctica.AAC.2
MASFLCLWPLGWDAPPSRLANVNLWLSFPRCSTFGNGRSRSRSPSTARIWSPTRSTPSRAACPPGTRRLTRFAESSSMPSPAGPLLTTISISPAILDAAAPTVAELCDASHFCSAPSSCKQLYAASAEAKAPAARSAQS